MATIKPARINMKYAVLWIVSIMLVTSSLTTWASHPEAIVSIGYSGSPGKDLGYASKATDATNGIFAAATFNFSMRKNFAIRPEVSMGARKMSFYDNWVGEISFRALGLYTFNLMKIKPGVFTGPRMDIKMFQTTGLLDGAPNPDYSRINAYWMFGLMFDIGAFEVRASYSLPFSNYILLDNSNSKRLNIFEASIGYRFKIGR